MDSKGTIVVQGNFEAGPWSPYTRDMKPPETPCILVTDELFPQIFNLFPFIKGIICEGGAITSHLAILAREHDIGVCSKFQLISGKPIAYTYMPLWIQVGDARKKYCQLDQS